MLLAIGSGLKQEGQQILRNIGKKSWLATTGELRRLPFVFA